MYEQAQELLREASVVLFDVDSVVIKEELIDELAKLLGKEPDAVSITTRDIANGEISVETGFRSRMDMIRPTLTQMKEFVRRKPFTLTPNIKPLIKHLQDKKIPIYLKTSGFDPVAREIAKELRIRQENIFTNRLKYYYNGLYAGFDEDSHTAHSSGIGRIVKLLKSRHGQVAIIGNSIDNNENFPPRECHVYIGYGGNKLRHPVRIRCRWYVTDFREILYALTTGEQNSDIEILRRFLQGVSTPTAIEGVISGRVTKSRADDSKPSSSTGQASSSRKSDCDEVDCKGADSTVEDSKTTDSTVGNSKTTDNKPTSSKGKKGRKKK